MTEREYRALPQDSYSSVKTFIDSRRKYFRKYMNDESIEEEEDNLSMKFGSLVDCLLFSPDEFESRFVVADYKLPTGQMLDFVNALWRRTKESMGEDGRVTREFVSLCTEAYNDVAFNANGEQVAFKQRGMTVEKVIERFATEGESYYRHLRDNGGKYCIEVGDMVAAENAIRELKSNVATRTVINAQTNEREGIEVFDQLVIQWDYLGLPMKSMLDRVIVNHAEKKVYQYDLKSAWNVDGFHYNYLKLRYYIQVACYGAAVLKWVEENNLVDYEVVPMRFIVVDNTGISAPLVYRTSTEQLTESIHGFTAQGRTYVGMKEAIEDLKWHKQMGLWTISRQNYDNRGLVALNYKQ